MNFYTSFHFSMKREISWLKESFWNWGMISILPVLFGLIIWMTFAQQVPFKLSIGVMDLDHTTISRQIIRYLDASPGLTIKKQYLNRDELVRGLKSGEVMGVLEIPKNMTRLIKTQKPATVVLYHNAQFGTHSGLIQKDVRTVIATLSAGIEINILTKKGMTPKIAKDSYSPLQNIVVTMYNLIPNYQLYLATCLIPAIIFIITTMTGAFLIGRELRDKTIKEWLSTININKIDFVSLTASIIGKFTPSVISLTAVGLFFFLIYHSVVEASIGAYIACFIAFILLIVLSIIIGGYFTLFALSLRKGLVSSSFFTAPAFVFSGVGFPLLAMPTFSYFYAHIIPLTYYLNIQVGLLQMAAPISVFLLTLGLFSLAILIGLILLNLLTVRALRHPEKWGQR